MRRNSLYAALGLCLPILLALVLLVPRLADMTRTPEQPSGIVPPGLAEQRLVAELNNMDPHSPQARELVRAIKKIRLKAHPAQPRANSAEAIPETPGDFMEALAQIKTARDGSTYTSDYKRRELEKAIALKRKRAEPLPWIERGPGNVSGRVRAIAVDPRDASGSTWLAATIGGGVWKTTNAGQSWTNKTPNLATLACTTIAMAASNPETVYLGTGMGYGRIVDLAGSGVWKSLDGGETWFQLASTANGQLLEAINRIIVDPNDENRVLLCSNDGFSHLGPKGGVRKSGIFRSTDGGASWTQVFDSDAVFGTATDNRVQQIIADPTNFNRLFATVNEVGVVRSVDAGLTWSVSADFFALPTDIANPPINGFGLAGISVRTELAIAPSDPNRIYAAVERPRGVGDIYMSRNGGASWVLVNDTGNDPNWFNSFGVSGATGSYTSGWFNNTIAVSPYDANVAFLGGVNLYRMTVNANAATRTTVPIAWWVPGQGVPQVHGDHHFLVTVPKNAANNSFWIIDPNDGGVGISFDQGNGWALSTGMTTTQFYGVDKKPGENVYIGGMQDNGTWSSPPDPGALSNWTNELGGDGFEVVWNYRDPNLVLGCSQYGSLNRSIDGANSWFRLTQATAGNMPFITKIANSKADPDLVFSIGSSGVLRSDNFGENWTLTPVQGNWLGWRPFDNVEVSIAQPRVVWISSRADVDPASGLRGGVHVSTDSGLSFNEVTARLPPTVTESSGLATHPFDAETAYLLFAAPGNPKVLRTVDLGFTWIDISGFDPVTRASTNGFPDVAVFSLLVMPFNTDIIWAGTEIGLFVSNDGGASWEVAANGLPNVAVFQMSIVDDQILLATQGRGIFTLTLPELAGYRPPQVTLSPRLPQLVRHPSGHVLMDLDLRSPYDRTDILVNGSVLGSIGPNSEPETRRLWLQGAKPGQVQVALRAFKDGEVYSSSQKSAVIETLAPASNYANNFNGAGAANDFTGSGLTVGTPAGFSNGLIQSPHPYPNGTDLILQLKVPLRVPAQNAILSYDDVAIVEPGAGTVNYRDPNFFDFTIVEASRDGFTWLPLLDGYDARFNQAWLNAFNSGAAGTQAMFVNHRIDLLDVFEPGDLVFVRFRLFADSGAGGWGWAIDNLTIFAGETAQPEPPRKLVYPWISNNNDFESILVANNVGSLPAEVTLTAWREGGLGDRIESLIIPARGFLKRQASELFPNLGDGRGYTVILETDSSAVHGRWVTNNLTAATGKSPSQGVAVEMAAPGQVQGPGAGGELLFGYLPLTGSFISAPAVVNAGPAPTNAVLSFYNQAGTLLLRDETTLAAMGYDQPFARVANTLVAGEEDVALIVSSPDQPLTGVAFVFNAEGETAIGNAGAIGGDPDPLGSDLLYAWVSNNEDFESILIANNTGAEPALVTLMAGRREGMVEAVERQIPAHGFLKEQASSLFPGLGDGAGYAVRLLSDSPNLHGRWVTNNLRAASGASPSQGVAVRVRGGEVIDRQSGESLLFGFLPVTDGLISAPVVVNTGDSAIDVGLYFYNQAGQLIAEDHDNLRGLAPFRPFATVVNQLLPDVSGDVYLVARAPGGRISGVAFVFNAGAEPAIGNATGVDFTP